MSVKITSSELWVQDLEASTQYTNSSLRNLTTRTCSQTWDADCSLGATDDTFDDCNPASTSTQVLVHEATVNVSRVKNGETADFYSFNCVQI